MNKDNKQTIHKRSNICGKSQMCSKSRAYIKLGKQSLLSVCIYCWIHSTVQHALLYIVDFAISGWMRTIKKKQNKQKRSLVKSNGMKTSLSLFCTLKQNQLPLACLGVEGEGSTQKPCNYSVLAQQQSAKGASKAFLWANVGSLRGKMQPVHEYHCMDFGPLQRHRRQKMCASVSMGVTVHNHFDYLIVQSASPVLLQEVLHFFYCIVFYFLRFWQCKNYVFT